MVSVKYSVLCFRILYHEGQSAFCDVIMVTKTSSQRQHNVSTKSIPLVKAKSVRSDIRLAFQANVATLGSTLVESSPGLFQSPTLSSLSRQEGSKLKHAEIAQCPNYNYLPSPVYVCCRRAMKTG